MAKRVRLNHPGVAEVLKSAKVAAVIRATAQQVAANAEQTATWQRHKEDGSIVVESYVTDRAAASVTLAHPGGLGMEDKHGALTQSAAAAGLEVNDEDV